MVGTHEEMALAKQVQVRVAGALLEGSLWLPPDARGVVLFPHGRGMSRDPRDGYVAGKLRKAGLGTLLLDLLTIEEANFDARMAAFRFDIGLLTGRLAGATDWLVEQPTTRDLRLGYFGAGYGACAALLAAAERPGAVDAVVANDGLPEYAKHAFKRVVAPTLFIGGLNRVPLEQLGSGEKRFMVVPGANHASEDVAWLATDWFTKHLNRPAFCNRAGTSEGLAVSGLSGRGGRNDSSQDSRQTMLC
jgi:putative phosphoribosyl transferase